MRESLVCVDEVKSNLQNGRTSQLGVTATGAPKHHITSAAVCLTLHCPIMVVVTKSFLDVQPQQHAKFGRRCEARVGPGPAVPRSYGLGTS